MANIDELPTEAECGVARQIEAILEPLSPQRRKAIVEHLANRQAGEKTFRKIRDVLSAVNNAAARKKKGITVTRDNKVYWRGEHVGNLTKHTDGQARSFLSIDGKLTMEHSSPRMLRTELLRFYLARERSERK